MMGLTRSRTVSGSGALLHRDDAGGGTVRGVVASAAGASRARTRRRRRFGLPNARRDGRSLFLSSRRSPLLRNAASFKALRHVICLGFLLVRVFRLSTRGVANPSTSWKHQPDDKALTGAAKRPILDAIAVNSAWPARRSVIVKAHKRWCGSGPADEQDRF